jgi:hypothetical protein
MATPVTVSKNMPQKFSVADGGNSFVLGRKAFFNDTHKSHLIENLGNNNSSSTNPRPLPNQASDLRTQRLRLAAIGGGSSRLKNIDDTVSYKSTSHINVVNTARTRARGGGGSSVPKKNSIPRSS